MFTIAKREDQGPPLPQSGFPPVGVDGLACGFGHTVGVDVPATRNASLREGALSTSHPERRRDASHLGEVEPVGRHEVSGSLIDRLSQTPHPPQAVPLPPLGKAYSG